MAITAPHIDTIAAALATVPADDRETWVRIGMSVKSELGDGGYDLWNAWSRQSASYRERDARAVWKSIKAHGGIGIGTLYAEAQRHGWTGKAKRSPALTQADRRQRAAARAHERQRTEARAVAAAKQAQQMIQAATLDHHGYLTGKGFPEAKGLVLDGQLLIPMRDERTGALLSLQTIQPDGRKRFLAGGRAKGAVHRLGRSQRRWYCEGYATGLSIAAALRTYLYRRDQVVVCFSAGNLAYVASEESGYVVADHDASGAGETYARKTGLLYWLPPELGDANDFHQRHGLQALADALRGFMGEARIR